MNEKILRLYKFKNYYNRKIERKETIEEYGEPLHSLTSTNFNPNDDVSAEHVFNYEPIIDENDHEVLPDYMVVTSDDNKIISRWWVIDSLKLRNGQYRCILLRDVIADYYNEVLNATTFIEKAKLGINNRLIFNDENMGFNQQRQKPILIQDKTKMPWVVAYIPKNVPNDGGYVDPEKPENNRPPASVDRTVKAEIFSEHTGDQGYRKIANFTNSEAFRNQLKIIIPLPWSIDRGEIDKRVILLHNFNFFDSGFWDPDSENYTLKFYPWYNLDTDPDRYKYLYQDLKYGNIDKSELSRDTIGYNGSTGKSFETEMGYLCYLLSQFYPGYSSSGGVAIGDALLEYEKDNDPSFVSENVYDTYEPGLLIKDTSTGAVYVCNFNDVNVSLEIDIKSGDENTGTLYNQLGSIIEEGFRREDILRPSSNYPNLTDKSFKLIINGTFKTVYFSLTQLDSIEGRIRGYANRVECIDALYDVVCSPYSDNYEFYKYSAETDEYKIYEPDKAETEFRKDAGLRIITSFITLYGSGQAIDVQIVPFCPIKDITLDIENSKKTAFNLDSPNIKSYDLIQDTQKSTTVPIKTRGILFWAEYSNISDNIPLENPIEFPTDPIELKVKSQTEKYRITSPFFEASYEFNPYKNGGVSELTYYASFKPYQPYFKVTPVFNSEFLYGQFSDFDARGCISTTNYSATQISDSWANFILNNNTYKESFDRLIQSMELNNSIQDTKDIYSATFGTISGAAGGASTGAMLGGGWGALAGGIVGGITSGIMGSVNLDLNRMLRNDAIDYTKDQFGYQLGNIKALPLTISKLSGITKNNPLHFILEKYTCTDNEEEAFRNKIKFNGMTVMAIGSIGEYRWPDEETYIKGKLIRIENIPESYHVLNQIGSELNKGVYI